jgi:glutamyl-tRNA synthetase
MSIRARIAPSPTGYMHIGTLHTVLFNYFFTRQKDGAFIIRIEDTDQKRFVDGALEGLLKTLQTLGLEHDEGPVLNADGTLSEKGEFGPYIQSKRLDIYRPYVDQLVEKGHAYVCFCTAERLDEMRKIQEAAKQTPKYDRHCLSLSKEEIESRKATESFVVRMKVPDGSTTFDDAVRGNITIKHSEIDDQVLLKSDGFPTYHMAVVVDDHLMQITHIMRGEEWLPSTPKQVILYQMLGWDVPTFAHIPLLLNADKKKLSKRQGDVAVEDFLQKGYLIETLINFVGTLGFNPKADQEIYSKQELIDLFDLSRVNRSGAVMNIEKLDWMNHHYIALRSPEELAVLVKPFAPDIDLSSPVALRALAIEKTRANRLTDFAESLTPYLAAPSYDPAILVWKKADKADAVQNLKNVADTLSGAGEGVFEDIALIEGKVKEYIALNGLSNGNVLWPLRVALSGAEKSAGPFELIWVLGQAESLKRIETALSHLS